MYDIELRKDDRIVGRQVVQSRFLTEALRRVRHLAARLGADTMTVTDGRGDLVGVFQASFA